MELALPCNLRLSLGLSEPLINPSLESYQHVNHQFVMMSILYQTGGSLFTSDSVEWPPKNSGINNSHITMLICSNTSLMQVPHGLSLQLSVLAGSRIAIRWLGCSSVALDVVEKRVLQRRLQPAEVWLWAAGQSGDRQLVASWCQLATAIDKASLDHAPLNPCSAMRGHATPTTIPTQWLFCKTIVEGNSPA